MVRLQACGKCGKPHEHGKRCPHCTRTRRRAYDQWERNQDAKAFYNSAQWKRTRKAVGERDHYVCQSCRKAAGKSGHCDHIIPREDGGSDEADNLQWLCHGCHSRKTVGEMIESERNVVVAGPPCSGKSTWVRERMKPGDLVIDLDRIKHAITDLPEHETHQPALRIALAMQAAAVREIQREAYQGTVYYVTTNPSQGHRDELCRALGAREHVVTADQATCLDRLKQSPERMKQQDGYERRIAQWFDAH